MTALGSRLPPAFVAFAMFAGALIALLTLAVLLLITGAVK